MKPTNKINSSHPGPGNEDDWYFKQTNRTDRTEIINPDAINPLMMLP